MCLNCSDINFTQLIRMFFVVEEYVCFNPVDVRFFGSAAEVSESDRFSDLVK